MSNCIFLCDNLVTLQKEKKTFNLLFHNEMNSIKWLSIDDLYLLSEPLQGDIIFFSNSLSVSQIKNVTDNLNLYFDKQIALSIIIINNNLDKVSKLKEVHVDDFLDETLETNLFKQRIEFYNKFVKLIKKEQVKNLQTTNNELLQLKKAIETMQLGVTISNTDGIIIYTNPFEAKLHGYKQDELIGKKVNIFAPSSLHKKMNLQQIRNLTDLLRESINLRKDGTIFPVRLRSDVVKDIDNNPIAIVTTCEDITAAKEAEMALYQSEDKFRQLTEAAPFAIFILKNEKVVYANMGLSKLTGFSIKELMDQGFLALIHTDLQKFITEQVSLKQDGDSTLSSYEVRIKNKKDKKRWIYLSLNAIMFEGKYACLATATDITAQKLVEDELRSFNENLEKKVKERTLELNNALEREKELNELKSNFISIVSHEFRTPLTSISSSAEIIERYHSRIDEEKLLEHLHRIQDNVKEMTNMLTDVIFIGKTEADMQQINFKMIKLKPFCIAILKEFELISKNRFFFDYSHYGKNDEVFLDENLLRHILFNLISNAIKYSKENSTISLESKMISHNIIFIVKDTGIGISEKDLLALFEPFTRGENVGSIRGTGLGLAIVKRCVEILKGDIRVTSKLGKGTQFVLSFPLFNKSD